MKLKQLFSLAFFMALALSQAKAAGFRTLELNGDKIGVWYPTDEVATKQRLGPFDAEFALNAQPKAGKWPVVFLSHGNGGYFRNHHLTGEFLADAGFIVIAPNHKADHLIGGEKTAGAIAYRVEELRRGLETVKADKVLGAYVDTNKINAVGYSLGTVSVMVAAGSGIDMEKVDSHCKKYGVEDKVFCEVPDLLTNVVNWIKKPKIKIPDTPNQFSVEPFVNGFVALVAPIGQGLVFTDKFQAEKVLIFTISGDEILQPVYHAEVLARMIPKAKFAGMRTISGHHFAFIAPFAKRVTDVEDIPVAKDPAGFDRGAFIRKVNGQILKFFLSHD